MRFCKVILKIIFFLLLAVTANGQAVYKTPSGSKYHLATCRMVKNTSEQLTIAAASALGLQPCKICNPPGNMSMGSSVNKANGEGATV